MFFEDVKFNPYDQESHAQILNRIEQAFHNFDKKDVLLELSLRIYHDNSIAWGDYLVEFFRTHKDVTEAIYDIYIDVVNEDSTKELHKTSLSYLITHLASEDIISLDFINPEIISKLNDDARFLVMSFLASWNLEQAISLDKTFVIKHFNHLLEAKNAPLKELIIHSLEEDQYLEMISNIITNGEARFHIIQVIIKIINGGIEKEREIGIKFITKCLSSNNQELIELAMDLFEFSTIKEAFFKKWKISFTENIFKYLSRFSEYGTSSFRKVSLMTINKIRQQVPSIIGLAARNEFDRLDPNDTQYMLDRITNFYRLNKVNSYPKIIISENENWDTIDYAYDLLLKYRKYYNEEFPNVYKLASSLGIIIDISTMNTEKFDACLLRDASLPMPVIFVNDAKKTKGRINFSIAHEIAHAVLPKHVMENFFCYVDDISESNKIRMDKWREREANDFASYILLPDKEYKNLTRRMDFTYENLYKISRICEVSLTFAALKWVKLSNLQIGIVVSKGSIVEWSCLSKDFPYRYEDLIKSISPTSSACIVLNNSRAPYKQIVNSSIWFDEEYAKYTISEESIKIFDDQVLTLLQIVDEH